MPRVTAGSSSCRRCAGTGLSKSSKHCHQAYAAVSSSEGFRPRHLTEPDLTADRSMPFGQYWRSSPFIFSLLPRSQGLDGSQK